MKERSCPPRQGDGRRWQGSMTELMEDLGDQLTYVNIEGGKKE